MRAGAVRSAARETPCLCRGHLHTWCLRRGLHPRRPPHSPHTPSTGTQPEKLPRSLPASRTWFCVARRVPSRSFFHWRDAKLTSFWTFPSTPSYQNLHLWPCLINACALGSLCPEKPWETGCFLLGVRILTKKRCGHPGECPSRLAGPRTVPRRAQELLGSPTEA